MIVYIPVLCFIFIARCEGLVSTTNHIFISKSPNCIIDQFRQSESRVAKCRSSFQIQMKDASSAYWFSKGDKVRVTSSVMKAGFDLMGREGVVTETWEKCDVDPTCCCAEFVDENYAVNVKFQGSIDPDIKDNSSTFIVGINDFSHFFAEEELVKVKVEDGDTLPFDGMSCKAFKLDQLNIGEQPRRIGAYDPNQSKND